MKHRSALPCLLLSFISHVYGTLIQATAGEDVKFILTENCKQGRGSLSQRLDDHTAQLIASLRGDWKAAENYTNRVNVSSDSLILTSADFNDEGLYEFTCNEKYEEGQELQVFIPSDVAVTVGENATLPCRSVTAGQRVTRVRWRRSGERVLELDVLSGKMSYGNSFDENRVSLPADWLRLGDLSLTIQRVQLKDEGVYYCDAEKTEKHRQAVRLRVHQEIHHTAATTPRPAPPHMPPQVSLWTVFITIAGTSVIVGPLAFLLGWKLPKKHKGGAGVEADSGQQHSQMRCPNGCPTVAFNNNQSSGDQCISINGSIKSPVPPEEIDLLPQVKKSC